MHKFLSLLILSTLLGFTYCSSDNNGASNPNKTLEEFENPTGTLASANAKDIVKSGISAGIILTLTDPITIFTSDLEYGECTETTGNNTTLKWDCAFNNVIDCDATGTTVTTDNADDDFTTVAYNDFSAECDATDPAEDLSVAASGDINISRTSDSVFCANVDYTNGDINRTFNGCRNSDGFILVRISGDSFVVRSNEINEACSELTTTIRDKDSTQEVTCEIQRTDGNCDGPVNIEIIGNCTVN